MVGSFPGNAWRLPIPAAGALLVVALSVDECRVLMDPEGARLDVRARVQTDAQVYAVRRGIETDRVRIAFSIRNEGRSPVFVALCGLESPRFRLQRRTDETWRTAFEPVCPQILAPPIEVAQGERHVDTAVVEASRRAEAHPRWQVDTIPGHYRLVLQVHESWDPEEGRLGPLVPLERRVSNTFRLTGPAAAP